MKKDLEVQTTSRSSCSAAHFKNLTTFPDDLWHSQKFQLLFSLKKSPLQSVRTLYQQAARKLTRNPTFVDFETTRLVGGLETFDQLMVRHACKRLISIDSRNKFYMYLGVDDCPWVMKMLSTFVLPVSVPSSSITRSDASARRLPTKYQLLFLQNELASKVLPVCRLETAPWNISLDSFRISNIESIRDLKTYTEDWSRFVDEDKSTFIKTSLYTTHLKSVTKIEDELSIISNFVDSRRPFWNYNPSFETFTLDV